MKILIYSFGYSWHFGGIVVLHKLAELISQLGYETYLLNGEKSKAGRAKCIEMQEAIEIANDSQTVVIYPEIVSGNPLNADKVARWILFFPGVNGGEIKYGSSEFVFTYSEHFVENTEYSNLLVVRIIETMVDDFYDLSLTRSKDAVLVKKGHFEMENRASLFLDPVIDSLYELESFDQIINNTNHISDYNLQLNQIRNFISYDNHTYHSVLASFAGCVSIVIPEIGKTSDKFFRDFPEAKIAGVHYGFEELSKGTLRKDLYKRRIDEIETENVSGTRALLDSLKAHFKLE